MSRRRQSLSIWRVSRKKSRLSRRALRSGYSMMPQKKTAFDVLHAKLSEQNVDQGAAFKKNLILALLRLHDHMQTAEFGLEEGSIGRERLAELRLDLIDILYAEDVEPIVAPSKEFDRSQQRALRTIMTNDP